MKPVLIIEDDELVRESFVALINSVGYDAVSATGAEEALVLLRGGLTPSLIVLDLSLPRMDGFAFRTQHLADPTMAHCPVLVCSGTLDDAPNLERLKGAAYLQKPIDPDVFLRFVRVLCGSR